MYLTLFLNNISSIAFVEADSIFYFTKDSILTCYSFYSSSIQWSLPLDSQHLVFSDAENLYPYRQYKSVFKIEKSTGIVKKMIEKDFFPIKMIHNKALIGEFGDKGQYFLSYLFLKDFSINNISNIGDNRVKVYSEPYFISQSDSHILICCFLSTAKENWRLDLRELLAAEYTELYGNIFCLDGRLFFYLWDVGSNTREGATFCIDIRTGDIIQIYDDFKGWLIEIEGFIYAYSSSNYLLQKLNPLTLIVEKIDFTDVLAPLGFSYLSINKIVIQGDLFYFVNEKDNSEAQVGILSIASQQLLWYTSIPIEQDSFWVSEIRVNANRLYVLTQGGTLHIFENEIPDGAGSSKQ